jgi:Chromosome segregation protein Csm1/Pcs1
MRGISDLLDSDVESSRDIINKDSILSTSTEGTGQAESKRKATQPKKTRKRKCVTMPKSKSRVAKASPAPRKQALKKTTAARRKALEEKVNEEVLQGEADSDEGIEETQPTMPRGRPAAKSKTAKAAANQEAVSENEVEVDQTPAAARSNHAPSRARKSAPKVTSKNAGASRQAKAAPKTTIRETRQENDVVASDTDDAMELVEQTKAKAPSRQNSRMRQEAPSRRRAGSASDTERGDPNLRRKLGDVTRRFENIDIKYRTLKDVGVHEANANMEKLRKQCEATTQASNELVASLKKELAMQAPTVQDARKLKKQIQTQDAEAVQLRKNNTDLSSALTAAQNEVKSLQAKLAAARSSSVAAESSRTPARDARAAALSKTNGANTSEAVQHAQMKEELYSDLTGLIMRGVKRGEDGDTYDCIQTGRNGSKSSTSALLKRY